MEQLDEYLSGAFLEDKLEIDRVAQLLKEVLPLFSDFLTDKGWPYEIEAGKPPEIEGISTSTSAMIAFALAVALGRFTHCALVPRVACRVDLGDGRPDSLGAGLLKALGKGLKQVVALPAMPGQPVFNSGSYGEDDPFTFAWMVSTLGALAAPDMALVGAGLKGFVERVAKAAIARVEGAAKDPTGPILKLAGDDKRQATDHAFTLLRIVQLRLALRELLWTTTTFSNPDLLKTVEGIDTLLLRRTLLSRVHEHLAYSSIQNSSFDAAELVFALEGVLLIDGELRLLDLELIDRVFAILAADQGRSAYWRPLKPFVTTATGLALLPLSVEIANSLLRVCEMLRGEGAVPYFSRHVEMFKRYTGWLRPRVVRGTAPPLPAGAGPLKFAGWHSEHVYVPRKIHPWETAQVAIYLAYYGSMLQQHVADTSLHKANFSVSSFPRQPKDWDATATAKATADHGREGQYWKETWEDKAEPLNGGAGSGAGDDELKVLAQIRRHFITPRADGGPGGDPSYSMLLYGPPGTGKSGIAERLAESLGWPLITITPSNFIARGEAEVEARARAIFETLEQQRDHIILFDEIDQLILDRDSKMYGRQTGILQFMTPGMLVKLKTLRSAKRSIFIIGTNYEERIDAAAKRKGRIDHAFCVMPPDLERRGTILATELEKKLRGRRDLPPATVAFVKSLKTPAPGAFKDAAARCAFTVYGELKQIAETASQKLLDVKDPGARTQEELRDRLLAECEGAAPAISLGAYDIRFRAGRRASGAAAAQHDEKLAAVQEPTLEFLLLVYLKLQAGTELSRDERKLFERARRGAPDMHKVVRDRRIADRLLAKGP